MAMWDLYLNTISIGKKILKFTTIADSELRGHSMDFFFNVNVFGELQDMYQQNFTYKNMATKYEKKIEEAE